MINSGKRIEILGKSSSTEAANCAGDELRATGMGPALTLTHSGTHFLTLTHSHTHFLTLTHALTLSLPLLGSETSFLLSLLLSDVGNWDV